MKQEADSTPEDLVSTIEDFHLSLGSVKCVSYLPITTINSVLNKTAEAICQQAKCAGLECRMFDEVSCWVKSGAVFFYCESELIQLMAKHKNLLSDLGWKANCCEVVTKIATEYFENNHPVMPFIIEAFGEDLTLR